MGHDNDAPMQLRMKDGFPRQAVLNTEDGLPRGNQVVDLEIVEDEEVGRRLSGLLIRANSNRSHRPHLQVRLIASSAGSLAPSSAGRLTEEQIEENPDFLDIPKILE